jgi:hypothetical protein
MLLPSASSGRPLWCCSAGAPRLWESLGEDILTSHLVVAHRRSRQSAPTPLCMRAVATPLGQPSGSLGRVTKPACSHIVGQARAGRTLCALGRTQEIGPVAGIRLNFLFLFLIQINSSSNFPNSYLFEYLSKNYETSFVGFLISISIHENYETER